MKGSQKKARQGVLLSVIDFEVLTSFNRFAVWVLGAGYFWTVTIDILGITRRTGTGWRHAMGVSILIRMLPIINQIVFVNEHASVLLKNVDCLLIAKPVVHTNTSKIRRERAATLWRPFAGSLHLGR